MTARQHYGRQISTIRKVTGETDRRLSFAEARDWMHSYMDDIRIGYPEDMAAQRAYDCVYAVRSKGNLWR